MTEEKQASCDKQIRRHEGFRIGRIHGKLLSERGDDEAALRNAIFLQGNLQIEVSRERSIAIHLIGYEIPLEKRHRGKSIDLLGYDEQHNPVIVELKQGSSTESLEKVVKQINGYEELFLGIRSKIENELRSAYLWKDFMFGSTVKKVILASREFYAKDNIFPKDLDAHGILCCSFARVRSGAIARRIAMSPNPLILSIEKRKGYNCDKVLNVAWQIPMQSPIS
jgi:hypothetical protein